MFYCFWLSLSSMAVEHVYSITKDMLTCEPYILHLCCVTGDIALSEFLKNIGNYSKSPDVMLIIIKHWKHCKILTHYFKIPTEL